MNNDAPIIICPNMVAHHIVCTDCGVSGAFITYKHFMHDLSYNPPHFYCNVCRTKYENDINIDFSENAHLAGKPFVPDGIIEWKKAQ